MRPQRSVIWAAFLAVAGLVAVGPGSARAADVIKFGVSTPLSGPAAPWGIPHKQATELIFDEINAQGGLEVGGKKYKLEAVAYDHKYVIADQERVLHGAGRNLESLDDERNDKQARHQHGRHPENQSYEEKTHPAEGEGICPVAAPGL